MQTLNKPFKHNFKVKLNYRQKKVKQCVDGGLPLSGVRDEEGVGGVFGLAGVRRSCGRSCRGV